MEKTPHYDEVAKFAETNTSHPKRAIIAYHIRRGQYDAALEVLASDPVADNDTKDGEAPKRIGLAELQMMIEHLREIETPKENRPQL